MATADIGTGTTIAFGTTGFQAQVTGVSLAGIAREAIDTSHMATTPTPAGKMGSRTFMPGDLSDGGELSLEIHFDPDDVPPISQPAEQVTVTFPIPAGLTNGATYVFSGFVTGFQANVPLEDKMTGTLTVKVSGPITVTAAS